MKAENTEPFSETCFTNLQKQSEGTRIGNKRGLGVVLGAVWGSLEPSGSRGQSRSISGCDGFVRGSLFWQFCFWQFVSGSLFENALEVGVQDVWAILNTVSQTFGVIVVTSLMTNHDLKEPRFSNCPPFLRFVLEPRQSLFLVV